MLLPQSFYLGTPESVGHALLGKLIVRNFEGELLVGRIVELEAYIGFDDPAAHSFAGKTERNAVIFGPPGFAYVYFIYGMYHCLNISCEPEGQAGCVLIRALEPVSGLERMAKLRRLPDAAKPKLLTSGPGRLCQALGITRASHNGLDVTSSESPLQIHDDGYQPEGILETPRIGISKAVERPLRYLVEGNSFVSRG
ncbi:DNA-3-methyladenine glycosylase [Silvibacterium acidisoli]|uniref:DNA-3-methyladenine glycosylase n=1 Tax=Acidobacteriaceae bacterium ZG23-2 TaxID=2883246 RepID=UPI00406CB01E